jgi:2,4-dienoyl-CoA reductase-like NADH-dependent reductase (Old Yellow Enzyme family)
MITAVRTENAGILPLTPQSGRRGSYAAIGFLHLDDSKISAMPSLFEPGRIGQVEVPNRVVMASMTTRGADTEGFVTPQTIAYFGARARGGVGLITVEMASPERCGRHRRREPGIYDDRFLPGLRDLVVAIHAHGAKASIQLGHAGGHTRRDVCEEEPIAPSAIPHVVQEVTTETVVPLAMTRQRINETTAAFAEAAGRARAAGFDCIEIHAAHGYLISQFHTPFENRRDDEYGGSLENRARFGLELMRRVKAAVPDLGVIYRLTVDDFFPQGLQLTEGLKIAQWAAEAGADAVHVAAGHYRSVADSPGMIPPMAWPDATFLDFARALKPRVDVPVIAVGRLGGPSTAQLAIANGACDFVALGRPLLADPEWTRKVKAGVPVRHCIACNTCITGMRTGGPLQCVVNALTGREHTYSGASTPRDQRIAIVGAGPAGLTYASLVVADNEVVVFERNRRPGGAWLQAGQAPRFQEVPANARLLERHITSLEEACLRGGAHIEYGIDITKSPERLAGFDLIVVASGARYRGGLGVLAAALLETGAARWPGLSTLFDWSVVRDFLYYRARRATGPAIAHLARPGQSVVILGDAVVPGKSSAAIQSAFEAALRGNAA